MIALGLLLISSIGGAQTLPPPEGLLRQALEAPAAVYSGKAAVGAPGRYRSLSVRYAPPGRSRREMLGEDGGPARLTVSDGKMEWTQDLKSGRHWSGPAAEPWHRRLGPDEADKVSGAYDIFVSSGEPVAGRTAWVLELRPKTGARQRRLLWIDRVHGVILRSRSLRPDGTVSWESGFQEISFPSRADPAWFKFEPPAGEPGYARAQADAPAREELRAAGLQAKLPAWLPSGYVFEGLRVLPYREGKKLIHYRFSDGVDVLSLFQCPPRSRLDFGKRPREGVRVAGGKGYLSWTEEGNLLGWSVPGGRMVIIGPLGFDVLKRVAESIR